MSTERVLIFDTTLRDGEQSPGCSMNLEEKLVIAHQLEKLGVDVIEAGFPIASEGDFEAVKAVAAAVRKPIICGLARTNDEDVDRAWEALKGAARPRIHVFIATSEIHMRDKLRMSKERVLDEAVRAVTRARGYCEDVEFSCEDATRSDWEYLVEVCSRAIAAGARTLNIPDTVGYTTPFEYSELITYLRQRVKDSYLARFSVHCHDDLGLSVANSLAAIRAGARQVECTVNGIGERAGNASLEELVMAFKVRQERLPYTTNVNTRELYPSSDLLTRLTGQGVQANKAIVGRNAFAHEAGIHQDGMMKDRRTYEIMRAEEVGAPWNPLVLGKHSGRHAVQRRCSELGLNVEGGELVEVYRALMAIADDRKTISDNDVVAVVSSVRTGSTRHDHVDPFDTPSGVALAHHPSGYGHGV